jgi:hypothetical protein
MTMLRKLVVVLFCAAFVLAPSLAEARAGGSARPGGTMGYSSQGSLGSRSYSPNGASPLDRSMTPQSSGTPSGLQPGFAQSHPFLTGLAGAFFGSWLGSLLFPHWGMGYGYGFGPFGALFSWLIIIWIIAMAFRLFRGSGGPMTVPPLGGMLGQRSPGPPSPSYRELGGRADTGTLPIGESDYAAFEAILKTVQGAWSKGDLATLKHYVTPEMLSYFNEQLAGNSSQGVENRIEDIELIKGDLREAWDEGGLEYASCLLHWRAIDYTVRSDRKPGEEGWLADGDTQRPSEAQEVWTFVRSRGGHWLLSAIQQV